MNRTENPTTLNTLSYCCAKSKSNPENSHFDRKVYCCCLAALLASRCQDCVVFLLKQKFKTNTHFFTPAQHTLTQTHGHIIHGKTTKVSLSLSLPVCWCCRGKICKGTHTHPRTHTKERHFPKNFIPLGFEFGWENSCEKLLLLHTHTHTQSHTSNTQLSGSLAVVLVAFPTFSRGSPLAAACVSRGKSCRIFFSLI